MDYFVEWLAEWAREARRRQRGLLLMTAHRAKGLEFDHVVVLDGGWDRVGHSEDSDAPRRLYYVAMTRARQTLALARFPGPHRLQDTLGDIPSVLRRQAPAELPQAAPELARKYRRLSLRDVFLSFAGYRHTGHPVHRAIASAVARRPIGGAARIGSLGAPGSMAERWWDSLPAVSRPPVACTAQLPRSWPSPHGAGRVRSLNTRTAFFAMIGK